MDETFDPYLNAIDACLVRDLEQGAEPIDTIDKMVDGTLFKAVYNFQRRSYRVTSYTPVERAVLPDVTPKPMALSTWVGREEAEEFRDQNWVKGYAINTAALEIGIGKLQPQIPIKLREIHGAEMVQGELEAVEGFGSF